MQFRSRAAMMAAAGASAAFLLAAPASTQQASGPVERYEMRAGTLSGLAGMGGGMGSALGMMMGRQGGAQHELELRLGGSNPPTKGAARAEHFMPAAMKLGKSVILDAPTTGEPVEDMPYQRPEGRLLIYWGCGANAPKGQPVVIDFAKVAAGQIPPGLFQGSPIIDRGPTSSNSRTFTRWPGKDRKTAKPESMLPGAHRVASNYGPDINFSLAKDFMAPLAARGAEQPGGATNVTWGGIPDATGYYLWVVGGQAGPDGKMKDLVWWSSSATRAFGGALADWISPSQVAGLVKQKQVLPPTTTQCTVPAEVKKAAGGFSMGMLYAYGPEENFSYPPKPADPKAAWKLDWTARVRHRSMTMFMLGAPQGMPQMDEAEEAAAAAPAEAPKKKKKCGGGLGGMIGGAIGVPGC